jgi:tripartite-type tricarboxylate transporter receptor subunit TctC
MKQRVFVGTFASLLIFLFVSVNLVLAAAYPTRPIEWYATMGLGTQTGMVMRVVADVVEKYLGGSIQVIPVAGGGGTAAAPRARLARIAQRIA